MIKIIVHRGDTGASVSGDLKNPAYIARQHSQAAMEEAVYNGYGIEADVFRGRNGSIGISAAEIPAGRFDGLTLPKLLDIIRLGDEDEDARLYLDIKMGRLRQDIARDVNAAGFTNFRIFSVENPSDWRFFQGTPEFAGKLLRMKSDENPIYPGEMESVYMEQAAGVWLDQFMPETKENNLLFKRHAKNILTAGKELVIVSPDLFGHGIDAGQINEAKQPYRRQWVEQAAILRDVSAEIYAFDAGDISICTNFPDAARDFFGPLFS